MLKAHKSLFNGRNRIILCAVTTPPEQRNGNNAGNGGASEAGVPVNSVKFHYIKGPDFRTIHIDGAIGGITPSGFLHIAMYCERAAIPKTITQEITPDGSLGNEIAREGREGVARQMEIDIILNEATARNLRVWLDQKLDEFERRRLKTSKGG